MSIVHKKYEQKVREYLSKNLPFEDIELFDVTYRRERGGNILRVVIDGQNVGLEECTKVSNFVSEWLDSEDFITERYSLEVSTPGIDRPLKSKEDFIKFKGKLCKITLKTPVDEGRKNFKGIISSVVDNKLSLFVEQENKSFEIDIENIKKAKLEIDF
ncbi:MAG: Ribosome maturation factor rimP [Deferribacteraceae bacterium]|jgi:ribosome maturation factor RimP|nr:Ribosome maturation factor rimP [Deferribacteraceae bacterium]